MSKYKLLLYQSYEKVGGLRWGAITGIAFLYWAMGTEPQEAKAFTEDHKNRHKCSQHCWPGGQCRGQMEDITFFELSC